MANDPKYDVLLSIAKVHLTDAFENFKADERVPWGDLRAMCRRSGSRYGSSAQSDNPAIRTPGAVAVVIPRPREGWGGGRVPDTLLIGWLTLIVLFLTGVVLCFYTVETYRLRKEAQLQTELQNRPFVSLILDEHRIFGLVNVGKGVATSVTIADVDLTDDRRYRLHAEPITHLGPGQQFRLRWTTLWQHPDGKFKEMWGGEHFPHQLLTKRGAQLRVNYQAIVGKRRYETVLSIREISD